MYVHVKKEKQEKWRVFYQIIIKYFYMFTNLTLTSSALLNGTVFAFTKGRQKSCILKLMQVSRLNHNPKRSLSAFASNIRHSFTLNYIQIQFFLPLQSRVSISILKSYIDHRSSTRNNVCVHMESAF